jgi:hypothetical protein
MAMRLRRPWQPALPDQEVSPASGRGRVDQGSMWSGREGLSKRTRASRVSVYFPLFSSEIFAGFWWGDWFMFPGSSHVSKFLSTFPIFLLTSPLLI